MVKTLHIDIYFIFQSTSVTIKLTMCEGIDRDEKQYYYFRERS